MVVGRGVVMVIVVVRDHLLAMPVLGDDIPVVELFVVVMVRVEQMPRDPDHVHGDEQQRLEACGDTRPGGRGPG